MASLENFRLVVFRTVAEQCSFRKAAEELHLTQPAVSLQIRALEDDIGVQLFNRAGSRIVLTEAGRTLLSYAQQVKAPRDSPRPRYRALLHMPQRGHVRQNGHESAQARHRARASIARRLRRMEAVRISAGRGQADLVRAAGLRTDLSCRVSP